MNILCDENRCLILLAERIDELGLQLTDLFFAYCRKLFAQYLLHCLNLPGIGLVKGIGYLSYSYHTVIRSDRSCLQMLSFFRQGTSWGH